MKVATTTESHHIQSGLFMTICSYISLIS